LILRISEVWGIFLKIYKKEAFIKSFLLFFIVQTLFLSIIMWQQFKSVAHHYDMRVSYDFKECINLSNCNKYQKDIISKYKKEDYIKYYSDTDDYKIHTTIHTHCHIKGSLIA